MTRSSWKIRRDPQVLEFIKGQDEVVQQQLRLDLRKLETRGLEVSKPLVGHYKGDVYYVRSKVRGHGLFRIFYFRDGPSTFHAFYAIQKKRMRLSRIHRDAIEAQFEAITGGKLT